METQEHAAPPRGRALFIANTVAVAALVVALAFFMITTARLSDERADRCGRIAQTFNLIGAALDVSAATKDGWTDEMKIAFDVDESHPSVQRLRALVENERALVHQLIDEALTEDEC